LREKLTYANVMVTVLAFLVLGGTGAYAAIHLGKGSVGTKQIKNGAVTLKKISASAQEELKGQKGEPGPAGEPGPPGEPGSPGVSGPTQFAEFYALMPPDNAATVAAGGAVHFPQNGPSKGGIARSSSSAFVLPDAATYRVAFSVPVTEAGQLELTLNSNPLPYTVYGRATGTSQIAGEALVTTTAVNSVVSVINPSGNATALTITPLAGGAQPVAASLVIEQLSVSP
jgi:hypothetical protein